MLESGWTLKVDLHGAPTSREVLGTDENPATVVECPHPLDGRDDSAQVEVRNGLLLAENLGDEIQSAQLGRLDRDR